MPFLSGVSDKKIEDGEGVILREKEREREKRVGGWRTRDGGGADMHLSPISSNTFHNSSALSLLPRLRTISPDAH